MRYSVQPRNWIFAKGYGFFSFAKNMGKNTDKRISESFSGKYSQKRFNHDKQSATDALKTSSNRIKQITAEATGDLIGNKIAGRITKVSRSSPLNSLETITDEGDKEMPK